MMLGFGWYEWGEKRCPSGKGCIPPIYGNFGSAHIKVPSNSPRHARKEQAEAELSAAPHQQQSWRAGIPRGNDVCIRLGARGNNRDAVPLKKRSARSHHDHQLQALNEIFNKSATNRVGNPPYSTRCTSPSPPLSATECNGMENSTKRRFYNVMWDPKVARGPTLVQFEEAQRAKWQQQVDSQRVNLLREQIRRRRRKMKEEGYLDTKSNPMRRIVYPTVTIRKEPLTFSSFVPFLTEECENQVETTNAGQVTDDVAPPGQNKNSLHSLGISAGVQTDLVPNTDKRKETVDWITATMIEKIPEQAVLELVEQAELDSVKAEQQRYELVFLYRKWQEMKKNQWNEYLRAWNEIRMREIMDQDAHLRDQQERISVIGFCKNAISSCFEKSSQEMKRDRFINDQGMPYEDFEELMASLGYQAETEDSNVTTHMARKVVDSTLINAVVQRFAKHMSDEYGRPHGGWLCKRGRHASVDHDIELQNYLENRWMKRREETSESLHAFYSEKSLFDIFDLYKNSNKAIKRGEGVHPTLKAVHSDPALLENLISKQRLGRRTHGGKHNTLLDSDNKRGGGVSKAEHGKKVSGYDHEDDVSMLYKRNTRWSKLEMEDEKHHHQHKQEQQKGSHPHGNVKIGSRLPLPGLNNEKRVSYGSRKEGNSVGGSATSFKFSTEWRKEDSEKWIETDDGESEKQREKLPSLHQPESRKQSRKSSVRFE